MCTLSACHFVSSTVHSIKYTLCSYSITVELILFRMIRHIIVFFSNVQLNS